MRTYFITKQRLKKMSDIVDKAVKVLMGLPKVDRDRIAWEIIDRVEDKNEWAQQ